MPLPRRPRFTLRTPVRALELGERTLLMGILNVTPDSFSDGGLYAAPEKAVERALAMEREGAGIVDLGAESTRPGSARITAEEEWARLAPVLRALAGRLSVPISVDTFKPAVAESALAAGAEIVNFPVLSPVAPMAAVAARAGAPLVLMHARGTPETMRQMEPLADHMGEVLRGLKGLAAEAVAAGAPRQSLLLDPGFGFGKNGDENFTLLARLDAMHALGRPLLAGTSRKSFIGRALGRAAGAADSIAGERQWGTAATVTAAVLAGAHVVRVHDVAEMAQVARVADRILAASL